MKSKYNKEIPELKVKKRPCLKCDHKFYTTPEVRICNKCHEDNKEFIGVLDVGFLIGGDKDLEE